MQNTITFDISSDVYAPAVPASGETPGTPAELYGPEYGGQITVRYPTIEEQLGLECRAIATIESFGVRDATTILAGTFELVTAMLFFDTCATEKPAWLSKEAPASGKGKSALLHAFVRGRGELDAGKKNSAGGGVSTSPTT